MNKSLRSSSFTRNALVIYVIDSQSFLELLNNYNKTMRSIDIKSVLVIRSNKFAFKKKSWFFINKKHEKRNLKNLSERKFCYVVWKKSNIFKS